MKNYTILLDEQLIGVIGGVILNCTFLEVPDPQGRSIDIPSTQPGTVLSSSGVTQLPLGVGFGNC